MSNNLESVIDRDAIFGKIGQQYDLPHTELLGRLEDLTYTVETGLSRLGLTDQQSKIYVFLAKKGAKKASEVAKFLNFPRTHTYNLLNSLQKRGLVSCTMHYPIRFVATPLDSAVKTLLDMEKQRLLSFESQSKLLLDAWSSIANYEVSGQEIDEEKFQILEGDTVIYRKIGEIVQSSKKEVMVMADNKQLITLYRNEVTDKFEPLTANGVDIKILTSSQPSTEIQEEIKECQLKALTKFNANLHYLVIDRTELIFFTKESLSGNAPCAIWTNCESLIRCIECLFEELWKRR